jgi:hypothetical protein
MAGIYPSRKNRKEDNMNSELFINNMLSEVINKIVNGKDDLPDEQKSKLKSDPPFKESNFFTWCTPGIPVSPEDFAFLKGLRKPFDYEKWKDLSEAEKDTRKGDEAYALTIAMDNFSILVDTVPNKTGIINSLQVWEPQNRISHIYESALKGSEVADTVPSPDAQERINKIRAATVETVERVDADTQEKFTEQRPSKMVVAYNKYAAEYLKAYEGYIDLMGKAVSGNAADVQKASILGPQKYKEVTAAYDMWESQGNKTQYEKLMADLAQLEGVSMSLLKREYLEIFTKSRRTSLLDSGDYSVARIVPGGFYESGGWTSYSFSSSHLKTVDTSKTQKYSGGGQYGLFGGAKGSHQRLDASNSINFEGATIEFELTQVPIVRAWFREDFLTSSKWRFKSQGDGANPADLLSNGKPESPEGTLFAYPTVIMFARNIKVTKTVYDKMSTEANRASSGSGGFNLGPLSLGAKASYNTKEKSLDIKQVEDKILVPGMQVWGFRNHILSSKNGPVPNPDPAIKNWI